MKPIEKLANLVNEAIEAREFIHKGTHHLKSIGNIDDEDIFFVFDGVGLVINKKSFNDALSEYAREKKE